MTKPDSIALVCLDPEAPKGTFRPMIKVMTKEEYDIYLAREKTKREYKEVWNESQ